MCNTKKQEYVHHKEDMIIHICHHHQLLLLLLLLHLFLPSLILRSFCLSLSLEKSFVSEHNCVVPNCTMWN